MMYISEVIVSAMISFVWAFLLSLLLLYVHIKLAWRRQILAEDAHKTPKPLVANLGGIVLYSIPVLALPLLSTAGEKVYLALVLSTVIGLTIGLIDDMRDLGLIKALFVALAGLPIILFEVYIPKPYIPIIGNVRMTLLYPLVVLAFFSIFADACNMIDIFNSVLVGQALAVLLPLMLFAILVGAKVPLILIAIGLGYVLAFLYWNRYPAKVFHANVGAYGLGSLLSAIIILSAATGLTGAEFVAIIGFLPAVYNGFVYVFSTRFAPRARLSREKKAVLFINGRLEANKDPNAALNLTRLLTIKGGLTEKQLIVLYYLMFLSSGLLATLTSLLIHAGLI